MVEVLTLKQQNVLLEKGDKPERGEGGRVDVEMEGCHIYYVTVQSHLLYLRENKVPFITLWIFTLLSQPCTILIQVFTVLKPGVICTFLIHFGSLQKMLTALFNLVWNTEKNKWTTFFECQGKMFLSIEKVLQNISEDQP